MILNSKYVRLRRPVSLLSAALSFAMLCPGLRASVAAGNASPAVSPVALGQDAASGPVGNQSITLPLSPTALNVFKFSTHIFKVQYPPGSSFSAIDMTVTAVPIFQIVFSQRVSATAFAKAVCLVYAGASGNCIDYKVTCATASGQPIKCPTTTSAYIEFSSSFDSSEPIVNPQFLTTPIGANTWQNVLDSFALTRIDPTAHGHTKGWSEFVAVAGGTTNAQGLGEFSFNSPLQPLEPKSFPADTVIPVSFHLASATHCGQWVVDALASVSVLMVANAQGAAVTEIVFTKQNGFQYQGGGNYEFSLPTKGFAPGTYVLTVYGDAFVSHEVYITIQ